MTNRLKKSVEKVKIVLAIDTSCDDTSVAILEGTRVLANIVSSSEELHRKWGGIVPDIARRAHEERIDFVIAEAFKRATKNLRVIHKKSSEITWDEIDAIAVTYGPGLAIALEIGITKAQELAKTYHKLLIKVNHMEGHLLSALGANLSGKAPVVLDKQSFPALGILISGGHTELILIQNFGKYEIIGETLDDAVGEAFDKVARLLGLGYPGAKALSEMAEKGRVGEYNLPIPLRGHKEIAFSYSGLKTAVYYKVKVLKEAQDDQLTSEQIVDLAAEFEYAAIKHIQQMLEKAIQKYNPKLILMGGGVVSNKKMRIGIRKITKKYSLKAYYPFSKKLFVDNAAMIGIAGYFKAQRGEFAPADFEREPRASITES